MSGASHDLLVLWKLMMQVKVQESATVEKLRDKMTSKPTTMQQRVQRNAQQRCLTAARQQSAHAQLPITSAIKSLTRAGKQRALRGPASCCVTRGSWVR